MTVDVDQIRNPKFSHCVISLGSHTRTGRGRLTPRSNVHPRRRERDAIYVPTPLSALNTSSVFKRSSGFAWTRTKRTMP